MRVESRRFFAEKMGEIVTDRLVENFLELMNYEFTAQMEGTARRVAHPEAEWKEVLDRFMGSSPSSSRKPKRRLKTAACGPTRW
ncbi:hypothetical protein ACLK2C_06805 [Escherichia coli]